MVRRKFGKAIGARTARKLMREAGGVHDRELAAEWERALGYPLGPAEEIVRLDNGRVLHIFRESANIYASADDARQLLKLVEQVARREPNHPLGEPFPGGRGFVEALPRLLAELPSKIGVSANALNGSVESLERIDKAARRLGGQECLDDPAILAPILAYAGEVMRGVTGGRWAIRNPGSEHDWQAVVVRANGDEFRTFIIFKELLERGSIRAVVAYEIGD
ncbi:MAG: hypothetical protein WBX25_09405 [Rhodomicrobium sp.]